MSINGNVETSMTTFTKILGFLFKSIFALLKLVAAVFFHQEKPASKQNDLIEDPFENDGFHDQNVALHDDGYKL